jgi:BNR/Asp-box repeat protein
VRRRPARIHAAAGAALLVAALGGAVPARAASDFPRVTANSWVTRDNHSRGRLESIPAIAVDPSDPSRVLVSEGDFHAGTCTLYVSTDGGVTFKAAKGDVLPKSDGFDRCTPNSAGISYPMAWGADDTLLLGLHAMPFNVSVPFSSRGPTSIVLDRTQDAGKTFQSALVRDNRPAKPANNEGAWQPHIASDAARNRVYVGWQRRNVAVPGFTDSESRPAIAVSTDGGKTFGPPIDLLYGEGDLSNIPALGNKALPTRRGPSLAVAPDGTLFALNTQAGRPEDGPDAPASQNLRTVLSVTSDMGKTFQHYDVQPDTDGTDYPEIAVVPNASGGGYTVVLVTEDYAVDSVAGPQQVHEIITRRSTDGGKTWSDAKRITDDPVGRFANKFDPAISVAPNGRVDVGWYDFRNDDGHMLIDVYATYSNDGGATWAPNVRITDRAADRRPGFFVDGGAVRGPLGVASDNYAAHFAWEDTRNATDEDPVSDIYSAALQFRAIPGPKSSTGLQVLAAIGGGLLVTAVVLLLASVISTRRRTATSSP